MKLRHNTVYDITLQLEIIDNEINYYASINEDEGVYSTISFADAILMIDNMAAESLIGEDDLEEVKKCGHCFHFHKDGGKYTIHKCCQCDEIIYSKNNKKDEIRNK